MPSNCSRHFTKLTRLERYFPSHMQFSAQTQYHPKQAFRKVRIHLQSIAQGLSRPIDNSTDNINHNSDSKAVADLTVQRSLATAFSQLAPSAEVHAVQSVEDAVEIVARHSKPQVFVTGSLHLVGGVLSVLEADHEREEKKIKR